MKILKIISIVLIITVFAIGCGSSGDGGEDTPSTKTTVTGTVLDDNGNPIEGAAVTIMSCPVTVTTDAIGFFSATIETGTHTLEIKMDSILIYSEQIISEENTPLQLSNITTNYDPDNIDDDGDSYTENQGDCNDSDININPGAEEICGDSIDQDCNSSDLACPNPNDDIDDDGDTFTENQGDCNDGDATIYPGALKICDGKDNNCDGKRDFQTDKDEDGDGVPMCGGDCNDSNSNINPDAVEICGDGIDQDCNLSDLTCLIS